MQIQLNFPWRKENASNTQSRSSKQYSTKYDRVNLQPRPNRPICIHLSWKTKSNEESTGYLQKNNTPQEAPQKKYKTSDGGSQHTIIHLWQMHIQGWKVLATCQPKTKATPPTPIVSYDEEDLYTPTRVETDTIHGVTLSYNKWHQKWLRNVHNKVKDTLNLISNCL